MIHTDCLCKIDHFQCNFNNCWVLQADRSHLYIFDLQGIVQKHNCLHWAKLHISCLHKFDFRSGNQIFHMEESHIYCFHKPDRFGHSQHIRIAHKFHCYKQDQMDIQFVNNFLEEGWHIGCFGKFGLKMHNQSTHWAHKLHSHRLKRMDNQ